MGGSILYVCDGMKYDHRQIEQTWQQHWAEQDTFAVEVDRDKPKFYCLDMFPYPSGAGLHVGHPLGYTATDIICRKKRQQGYNVLHPMGWDAFGLPAENFAIKTGVHPAESTAANIANFKRQIQSLGLSYDWNREVDTTDPAYYRWTQWLFLQLYQKGLLYPDTRLMNWCPVCKIVAANEEVENGVHERCGNPVERRQMRQWLFRITDYAERLLEDLDTLEHWPEKIKAMQRHWIGKSEGVDVKFAVEGGGELAVYTTRVDTLFGVTYMVVAPEHPIVEQVTTPEHAAEVEAYLTTVASKSDMERTELNKTKTGVFTGGYAVNPVNGAKVPVWVADYVLMTYGTGAIMAVPAHDERDYAFAQKYNLPITFVVAPPAGVVVELDTPYLDKVGTLKESGAFNGLEYSEGVVAIADWLEAEGRGERRTNYRLRDWIFTRQRYWGEPIPLVYDEAGAVHPLCESELPLRLPNTPDYQPSDSGESPLAKVTDWVNVQGYLTMAGKVKTLAEGESAPAGMTEQSFRRETSTMPNWAGSSWYWLRFMDPHNEQEFCAKEVSDYWGPVDLYVGGAEHAVLHLLYARFWQKAFYDLGLVGTVEPFAQLCNQGLIMAEDGRKMSKSLGNVVNPDEIVEAYGADTLRLYEMFMGPFEQTKQWSSGSVEGTRRFLDRVWANYEKPLDDGPVDKELDVLLHQTIAIVSEHIDTFRFNTAISQLMILNNALTKRPTLPRAVAETLCVLLSPFAPHLTEHLWAEVLGEGESLAYAQWPTHDPTKLVRDTVTYAVQVNGKLRGEVTVAREHDQRETVQQAKAHPKVAGYLSGKEIVKEIFVRGKIIGFVVK